MLIIDIDTDIGDWPMDDIFTVNDRKWIDRAFELKGNRIDPIYWSLFIIQQKFICYDKFLKFTSALCYIQAIWRHNKLKHVIDHDLIDWLLETSKWRDSSLVRVLVHQCEWQQGQRPSDPLLLI